MKELIEDHKDYLESGGILNFIGWLKYHHINIYNSIYK